MNLILACQISGIYDINRNTIIKDDDYSLVKEWADSIERLNLRGILFHNNFSESTISNFENDHLRFVRVTFDSRFNPNVFRYFLYKNFLDDHQSEVDNVFLTDVSDVVVVNNPFIDPMFVKNCESIFCGDEDEVLSNEWMYNHSAFLRKNISDFEKFEFLFRNETLLNCGIIGGTTNVIRNFLDKLCDIHFHNNQNNPTNYTGDMGAFNYIIRKFFNDKVIHGAPCNTIFKKYEIDRTDCWFRHK